MPQKFITAFVFRESMSTGKGQGVESFSINCDNSMSWSQLLSLYKSVNMVSVYSGKSKPKPFERRSQDKMYR